MPSRDGDGKVYSDVGSINPLQDVIIVLLYQAYPYPPPTNSRHSYTPGLHLISRYHNPDHLTISPSPYHTMQLPINTPQPSHITHRLPV